MINMRVPYLIFNKILVFIASVCQLFEWTNPIKEVFITGFWNIAFLTKM